MSISQSKQPKTLVEGRLTTSVLRCRMYVSQLRDEGLVRKRSFINPLYKVKIKDKNDITSTTIYIPRDIYPKLEIFNQIHSWKFEGWYYSADGKRLMITINSITKNYPFLPFYTYQKIFGTHISDFVKRLYLLKTKGCSTEENKLFFIVQMLCFENLTEIPLLMDFCPELEPEAKKIRKKLVYGKKTERNYVTVQA